MRIKCESGNASDKGSSSSSSEDPCNITNTSKIISKLCDKHQDGVFRIQ